MLEKQAYNFQRPSERRHPLTIITGTEIPNYLLISDVTHSAYFKDAGTGLQPVNERFFILSFKTKRAGLQNPPSTATSL